MVERDYHGQMSGYVGKVFRRVSVTAPNASLRMKEPSLYRESIWLLALTSFHSFSGLLGSKEASSFAPETQAIWRDAAMR